MVLWKNVDAKYCDSRAIMGAETSLKALTFRLTSTPLHSLPHSLPSLQNTLISCQTFIQSPKAQIKTTKEGFALDSFKKQLTLFLNDTKHVQRRWAATVLLKIVIDVGGASILQDSPQWIRGLLSLLGKWQDPATTKKVALVNLTKIFLLTHEYPSLVREITTPNLSQFVTVCLQNINFKPGARSTVQQQRTQRALTPIILESFSTLITKHPTIFRTFEKQLRELLLPLIAPTPSSTLQIPHRTTTPSQETRLAASTLFILLAFTAPKSTGPQSWNSILLNLLSEVHSTSDQLFRSILEDWRSTTGVSSTLSGPHAFDGEPSHPSPGALGLPPWEGFHAAHERLSSLLSLLKTFVITQTPGAITFPTASVIDLLIRLFLTTTPTADATSNQRTNDSCTREERETLWSILPFVHVAALDVGQALCTRLETSLMPIALLLLDHIEWTFAREKSNDHLRVSTYITTASLLSICGKGLVAPRIRQLAIILRPACADMIPELTTPATPAPQPQSVNSILSTPSQSKPQPPPKDLTRAASTLITAFLTHVLPSQTPTALRSLLDRTAILSGDKQAMLASVVNAPASAAAKNVKARSSILPFLAREYGGDVEVEGFLRPRLPVIVNDVAIDAAEENEAGSSEPADEDMQETDAPLPFGLLEAENSSSDEGSENEGEEQDSSEAVSEPRQDESARVPMTNFFDGIMGMKRASEEEPGPSKRARMSPEREAIVRPTDELVPPAEPLPVAVVKKAGVERGQEVVVEKAEDVIHVGGGEGGLGVNGRTAQEKGKMRAVEQVEAESGYGELSSDGDESGSDSNFSIPPLVLKGSSEEEDIDSDEEEVDNG